jgi:hypothetical protein
METRYRRSPSDGESKQGRGAISRRDRDEAARDGHGHLRRRLTVRAVDAGMTKCSKCEGGHDQALAVVEPVPPPDELKADIDALDTWVKSVQTRCSGKKRIQDTGVQRAGIARMADRVIGRCGPMTSSPRYPSPDVDGAAAAVRAPSKAS